MKNKPIAMTNHSATSLRSMYMLLSALILILYPVTSQDSPSTPGAGDSREQSPDSGLGRLIRNGNGSADSLDHRVILNPGRWKIRTPGRRSSYTAYHFFIGFNWSELEITYPKCSQVACIGLPHSHKGCDQLCSSGTWRDATITLSTATLEYNRAMTLLNAAFNDLAALMDTRIMNNHNLAVSDPVSKLLSYHGKVSASDPHVVDVMQYYRTLIEGALENVVSNFPSTLAYAPLNTDPLLYNQLPPGSNGTNRFNWLLDTWKSGAFKLAIQLNAVTFAFQGAHQRLLSCAQGVQRSDMTGCEPGFITQFYTDIPVASRSLSSSRLVMVVRRDSWNPVVLSQWYMAFIDSSRGNRTCWLDRHMVNDTNYNYRMPQCDPRGVCEHMEVDTETVSACEVNDKGEIGLECPVVCGAPCFGPICYQAKADMFTLRSTSVGKYDIDTANDGSVVLMTNSPRILSKVYSLSEVDIDTSIASVRNRSVQATLLLQQGQTVLQEIIAMDATARKYIDKVRAETASQSQGTKCVDCELMIGRSRFMAAASVTLSALTCPVLIILVVKVMVGTKTENVPVRTTRRFVDTIL